MSDFEERLRVSLRRAADGTIIPDLDITRASAAAGQGPSRPQGGMAREATLTTRAGLTAGRNSALVSVGAVTATVVAVLLSAALIARDVGGTDTTAHSSGGRPSHALGSAQVPHGTAAGALPRGWRWESYRNVQVAVPATWGDGASTSQLSSQWCIDKSRSTAVPIVGRPGLSTAVGCFASPGGGDPGTLIKNAGIFVGFDIPLHAPSDGIRHDGDRTTVTLDGVSVLIQAPAALRGEIAHTVSTFTTDSHGCPATHRISADPEGSPSPAIDVTTLTGVTAVSACKYALSSKYLPDQGGLISSIRLNGHPAAASVASIAQTHIGGGPDAPKTCVVDRSYGDEAIVLLVQSDQGATEIYLRYDGCDHHGFYDGTTVRTLTAGSVAPFIAGENAVGSLLMNGSMLGILEPPKPAAK